MLSRILDFLKMYYFIIFRYGRYACWTLALVSWSIGYFGYDILEKYIAPDGIDGPEDEYKRFVYLDSKLSLDWPITLVAVCIGLLILEGMFYGLPSYLLPFCLS